MMSVLPLEQIFLNSSMILHKLFLLKLELGIIVDLHVGAHFVKATYAIEGDGLLVLICYDRILEI